MIYLIPFLNALILYVCTTPGQLFYKPYTWFMENIAVKFPAFVIKILGVCALCTATWLTLFEIIPTKIHLVDYILFIPYSAVTTAILIKFMKL